MARHRRRTDSAPSAADALLSLLDTSRRGDVPIDGAVEAEFLALVEAHRVGGLVYDRVKDDRDLVSADLLDQLRRQGQRAWAGAKAATQVAQRVRDILEPAIGSRWVVVKGPALDAWYGSNRHRIYTDLDVLVDRNDFATAMEAIEHGGMPALTSNWDGFVRHGVAEVPMGSHQTAIDLHWHLVPLAATRQSITLDVAAMIDRQEFFGSTDDRFPTLDAEDTLLHLCIHGGLAGARRLVWLVDIDTVARSGRIDWRIFARRAREARASMMSLIILDRAASMLGTPVPQAAFADLRLVPGLLNLDRLTRRASRSDARRLAGWNSGLVQSAGRDTLRESARAIVEVATTQLQVWRGQPRLSDAGGDLDWNGPDAGPAGKQRWLDYIASDAS